MPKVAQAGRPLAAMPVAAFSTPSAMSSGLPSIGSPNRATAPFMGPSAIFGLSTWALPLFHPRKIRWIDPSAWPVRASVASTTSAGKNCSQGCLSLDTKRRHAGHGVSVMPRSVVK